MQIALYDYTVQILQSLCIEILYIFGVKTHIFQYVNIDAFSLL